MSKELPKISDAEWEVMKVLWLNAPLTSNEIIEALQGNKEWSPKTVRTLIKRLVEKRAVSYNQDGKSYSYYPIVKEADCVKFETKSFIKRIYGGAVKPMLVHFLTDEKLSKKDIEELKKILEQREE